MKRLLIILSLLTALLIPTRAQLYSVTDLGVVPGGSNSSGSAINNSGVVTGYSSVSGVAHGFSWSGGTMTDIHQTYVNSFAFAINSSGDIVGNARSTTQVNNAFLYTGGTMSLLGTLGGTFAEAWDINDSGVVVGGSSLGSGAYRAFSWTSGGGMVDLGTMGGGNYSYAYGVNNSGTVVGNSVLGNGEQHAFLYSGGTMTDLGLIPGGVQYSTATAINDAGHVTGYGYNSGWAYSAFYFDGSTMVDIGSIGGADILGYAINSSNYIVGDYFPSSSRAFLYTGSGSPLDLNNLLDSSGAGWVLTQARGISDSGLIVGTGTIGGQTHAFLLTPVPEPASIVSLLGGLGLLGLALQRRRCG